MFWNKRNRINKVTFEDALARAATMDSTKYLALHNQIKSLQDAVEQLRVQVTAIGGFVNADLARKLEGALEFQSKMASGDIVMGETHGF